MHPIENMMKTSMEQIREMVDVNTIIGDPVQTKEGGVIIPISKVSFGFVAGGGEYGTGGSTRESSGKDSTENPFAGGSGAGISLHPMAFVIVNGENIRLLPVQESTPLDRLMDLSPQLFKLVKQWMNGENNDANEQNACSKGDTAMGKHKKHCHKGTVDVEVDNSILGLNDEDTLAAYDPEKDKVVTPSTGSQN